MVSVIIPVYNVEQYIRQCIDSAIDQTYKDIEIILVDDGSTDNSGTICDEYAERDSRIKVIHKENGGPSDARNAGLDIVKGKYIYFLDNDDYIEKNALEMLFAFAEKEQAEIVGLNMTLFSDEENMYIPAQKKLKYSASAGAEHIIQRFRNENRWFPGVPLNFFRTDYLEREHLRFKKGIHYEDLLFTGIAYVRAEKVSHINRFLYYYRQRSESIMHKVYTLNDLRSYCVCIKGFSDEKKKHISDPVKTKALDILIRFAADRFGDTYVQMEGSELKGAEKYLRYVKYSLSDVTCVSCKRVMTKLTFLREYGIIRRILLPVKRAVFG